MVSKQSRSEIRVKNTLDYVIVLLVQQRDRVCCVQK